MAQQPDISAILAALAQRPNGTPTPSNQPTSQAAQTAGYPGVVSAASPANPMAGMPLPQPTNSGSLDLSAIKPASTGNVSLADAIAKARGMAAEKASSRDDPRLAGRSYNKRSRSRSRSPARRENYRDNYNPYRDERRDEPRRSSNGRERSFSPSNRAHASFSPANARDYKSPSGADSNTEVITVDSSSVGLIIGRAGENLRRVEAETGARVQFMSNNDPTGQKRQCKISGTSRQRADAIRDIFRGVEENAASGRGGSANQNNSSNRATPSNPTPTTQREADRTIQIMVPDRTVGLIIGRGGETIRDLQERSGCHINIVGENKSINGLRPVNLIGNRESSAKAKELIMEVVDSDTRSSNGSQPTPVPQPYGRAPSGVDPYGGGYAPPPVPYDNGAKLTDMMTVPSEAVGMIIGKGGETIKEMQNSTGCKINVSPPSGLDISREIGLIGTRSAIENAKRQIWDKVGTVREKQGGRIGGEAPPPMPYDAYAPHQPPAYGQPPGPIPMAQAMPPAPDQSDPYAAYGGYQNYMAMWYAAIAHQGGHHGGPPTGA